jgi:hypothetical protein
MKIRNGFVSNSSSSSFVIGKEHLTEEQLLKIREHSAITGCANSCSAAVTACSAEFHRFLLTNSKQLAEASGWYQPSEVAEMFDDPWQITETKDTIGGYTTMDNFDMNSYLQLFVGVSPAYTHFSH